MSFQSCSNSSEPELETNEVLVNTPTNGYFVKGNVTKLGIFGCANVSVYKDGAITDAEVKINEVEFFHEFDYLYSDSAGSMKYEVGKLYELTVRHNGTEIANGIAIMPSEPTITGLPDTSNHSAAGALTFSWKKPSSASSIKVFLVREGIFDLYETDFFEPGINSHTIPAAQFANNGDYELTVNAFHGFLPGVNEDSSRGYNISGAVPQENLSPLTSVRLSC